MAANLDHLGALELHQQGAALRALGRSLLAGDGDDLAQDGWLAAMQTRAPRHLGGWLVGTVRRLAASHRRRDARRRRRELAAARPEALPSTADTAAVAEVARRVAAAVEGLHEPYRSAVVLRFWHGLEPQQLGEELGVPANTARSRVQRGLELLRVKLSRDCGSRAAWAGPLTVMVESSAAIAVASSTTVVATVLLAMKTRLLLGVAVLVLAASGWWLLGVRATPPGTATDVSSAVTGTMTAAATPADRGPGAEPLDRRDATDPERTDLLVRLVDEHGLALVGMEVIAMKTGDRGRSPTAFTDRDGLARLSLPRGEYGVWPEVPVRRRRPDLYAPAETVQIAGDPVEVRFVMERYSGSVQVAVVDDLGVPVSGVVVERSDHTDDQMPRELKTDSSGTVLFRGLPPGQRTFALSTSSAAGLPVAIAVMSRSCAVVRDGLARLEYRLPRKANVRFVVRGVDDVDVEFGLQCVQSAWQYRPDWSRTVWGEVSLMLPPGTFELTATSVDALAPAICRAKPRLQCAAAETQEVVIPVEPATGVLSVKVCDERGLPIADANFLTVLPRQPPWWRKGVHGSMQERGRYEVRVPKEPLTLLAYTRGSCERNLAFFGGTDERPFLDLAGPATDVVVVLSDAHTIRGTVLDAQSKPILQGEVSLGMAAGCLSDSVSIGHDRRGHPTTEGVFEFRWLRPGRYPLWVGSREEGPPDAEVEVGPRVTPSHVAEVVLRKRAVPAAK